jgi:hypothetical protein
MPCGLLGHVAMGQLLQLALYVWDQLFTRLVVAVAPGEEQVRDL